MKSKPFFIIILILGLFFLVFTIPLVQASLIENIWYNTLSFFGIIEITNANHLNSDRIVISNIYDEVKELEGIWSETIPDGDYVRVTFEEKLTNKNDITLFPRIISRSPKIEVYEKDGNKIIAEFTSLNENQYNKVYLTNLQKSQDVFDLRIVDGSVEFDHIIDPTSIYDYNSGQGTLHFIYETANEANFPPLWTNGWGGTQIADYTNVQTDDIQYINPPDPSGNNQKPSLRFNFTISETAADINWIFVHINGYSAYGSGEDGDCFVANFNTQAWEKICDMPQTDGDCNFNITASITNYIDGDQLVYLCENKNVESGENLFIDYIDVTVDSEVTDTCTCPSINTNWEINMADYCVISTTCNLGAGNITFTGTGNTTFNAAISTANLKYPTAGQTLFIGSNAIITIG